MPAADRIIVLAKGGLLEVDHPHEVLDHAAYVFDDIVAISPGTKRDRHDVEFPAELEGVVGELVAVRTKPARVLAAGEKPFTGPGYVDGLVRSRKQPGQARVALLGSLPEGTEVVLGSGPVRLRRHTTNGRPTHGERTAIGVGQALDGEQVRSVLGDHVRLELRVAGKRSATGELLVIGATPSTVKHGCRVLAGYDRARVYRGGLAVPVANG